MSKRGSPQNRHHPQGIRILYEDRDILVVDKAAGLLTIGTDREKTRTAYYRLTDYVRKGNSKSHQRIFIVHRLDREASGILLFAKSPEVKLHLQRHWDAVEKIYLAVVHGRPPLERGTLTSYLAENRAQVVYSTSDPNRGKLSRTDYRVLQSTKAFSLLEIKLLTGRKNQIRVHLSENGQAIVGDQKYGAKDAAHRRLALHALSLTFHHPFSGRQVTFAAEIPEYFSRLMGTALARS